jgi:hypothetical protein
MTSLKDKVILGLGATEAILRSLVEGMDEEVLKKRPLPHKWSAYEHACHLAEVQPMLLERIRYIQKEEIPVIQPYLPGENVDDSHLISMDLKKALDDFSLFRKSMLQTISALRAEEWEIKALHKEYKDYGMKILVRHILMHDHLHMYRMEEALFTQPEFLQ